MLKVPRPGEVWECPKCGNRPHFGGVTNYKLQFYPAFESIALDCNRCGYREMRLPMDSEDEQ